MNKPLTFPVLLCAGLSVSALPGAALAATPSFDCSQASGTIEELICQEDDLATLDRHMAEVFPAAMANYPQSEQATAKAMQRGWIKGRNDCWKADDKKACVESEYKNRIVELQITGGLLEVPEPVAFKCNETDKPFTAVFYSQTDPHSAVLTWGDDQVIALIAPAASGSKYTGRNVEYWEHQGEARVTWLSETLTCQPVGK
ncbi:MliC family protein [Photobacterium atrarenae]|uniref:MliC family protein n=1 Tax=Photobacterium atrarenae TaxID=865757 RepID=A0ABY5GL64_9GAMM|nr:MliC family protein [Photobacterium atrarenae]UTV29881.1 MliC family protein [Photobacterium atrarenae]